MSSTEASTASTAPASTSKSLRVALVCGAAPLVTGTGIFLAWLTTRWDWLMLAGMLTIYAGIAAFLVGCVALFRYVATHRGRGRGRNALLAGLLLIANFPAAAGITVAAVIVDACYTVTIHNDSPDTLTRIIISGGGQRAELNTLAPGESTSTRFWFDHDGELTFSADASGQPLEATIDGYVTNGMGGDTRVTISASRITSQSSHGSSLITERNP